MTTGHHGLRSRRADSQRVFGVAEPDTSFDKPIHLVPIQFIEGSRGVGDILELNEAHRIVVLVFIDQLTVARALREEVA